MDNLILVDFDDNDKGVMEKLDAHTTPHLHRAFSIFLYSGNKMLIQRRAIGKYHSGGLLTNTCCSHPRPDKSLLESAKDRLLFETGIKGVALKEIDSFIYFHKFNPAMFEYEYDHILIGEYDGAFPFNTDEISEMYYVDMDKLDRDIMENPEKYSVWFITAYPKVRNYLIKNQK